MHDSFIIKINKDLTSCDNNFLEKLKECEEKKIESYIPKSYIKEYHPLVVVISGSRQFLDDFLETYGGVLQLEALFISEHEKNTLFIKRQKDKFNISVERPLILDPEKCTLCRKCVGLCEKGAIRPDPSVDISLCNQCGKCAEVCNFGAIDLFRRELIELAADEVVIDEALLANFDKSVPEGIFRSSALKGLFKKIGSFEIEELVKYQFELCSYDTRLKVGCKRCIDTCKNDAILQEDDGIRLNHELCIGCGSCISACPTGALEYTLLDDKGFVEYFRTLDLNSGIHIVIGEEDELKELWWNLGDFSSDNFFFFIHQLPFSLSSFHFLFLSTIGIGKVFILSEKDKPTAFLDEVNFTNSILKNILKRDFVEIVTRGEFLKDINGLKSKVLQVLNLDSSGLKFENRRQGLSYLLYLLYSNLIKDEIFISTDKFCQITLDNKCCLCLSCLNVCFQEALIASEEELALYIKQDKCINCKACLDICPEKAISLIPGLRLCHELFNKRLLIKDEPVKCTKCGKTFANKKSFTHTISILKEKGCLDKKTLKILSRCETCRAKAFFEEILNGK